MNKQANTHSIMFSWNNCEKHKDRRKKNDKMVDLFKDVVHVPDLDGPVDGGGDDRVPASDCQRLDVNDPEQRLKQALIKIDPKYKVKYCKANIDGSQMI